MKIAVAGTGYVGLSIAVLLAQHHEVTAVDIAEERVKKINQGESPIQDEYIEKYLSAGNLMLTAVTDWESGYGNADFIVIAVPTNYDSRENTFDTSVVDTVLQQCHDHGDNGGRGSEAVFKYISCPACFVL